MPHPANLLSLLIAAASIAGAVCWVKFEKNRRHWEGGAPVASAAVGGGSLIEELLPEPGGNVSTLQKQVQKLEDENRQLRQENADFREQVAKARLAKEPPPSEASIAEKMAAQRSAKFTALPKFTQLPLAEIGAKASAQAVEQIPLEASVVRTKAYETVGFVVGQPYDFRQSLEAIVQASSPVFYDAPTQTVFYQEDADLRRMDGRDRLAIGAHQALICQLWPAVANIPWVTVNDDAARAIRSAVFGELTVFRTFWSAQDDMVNLLEDTQSPSMAAPANAPYFLTEEIKAATEAGRNFVEYLLQNGKEDSITAMYQRPPQSTAEILHPERYLATPPFKPVAVEFPDAEILGKKPVFSNVVGELALQLMLRSSLSQELSTAVSDGWAGDRYVIYPGENPAHGDQLVWKTTWISTNDAEEFYRIQCRLMPRRYHIPEKPEYTTPEGFSISDPHRAIRIRLSPDKLSVLVINAADPAFADAAMAAF